MTVNDDLIRYGTTVANKFTAINNSKLSKSIMLGESVNLNDITTAGIYGQSLNVNAAAGSNYPVPLAGVMCVYEAGQAITTQTYIAYNSGITYTRTRYDATWYPWRTMVDSSTVQTAVPVGSVHMFLKVPLPVGFLSLNGEEFDGVRYPQLAAYLGGTRLANWLDRTPKMIGNDLTAGQTKGWEYPAHTHTRGTMNITGEFRSHAEAQTGTGAFVIVRNDGGGGSGNQWYRGTWNFDASRSWTGETSSAGNSNKVDVDRVGVIYAIYAGLPVT